MDWITQWITEIILLILVATVLELLLPESGMRRYARIVVSLLLLLALLSPVLSIFRMSPEELFRASEKEGIVESEELKKSINEKKSIIQASQLAYIEKQTAVRMKNNIKEEWNERFGVRLIAIHPDLTETSGANKYRIQTIRVVIGKPGNGQEIEGGAVAIEPVTIRVETERNKREDLSQKNKLEEKMVSFLAAKWGFPEKIIELKWEGGEGIRRER